MQESSYNSLNCHQAPAAPGCAELLVCAVVSWLPRTGLMASVHLVQAVKRAAHSNDTLPQITGSRFELAQPTAPPLGSALCIWAEFPRVQKAVP